MSERDMMVMSQHGERPKGGVTGLGATTILVNHFAAHPLPLFASDDTLRVAFAANVRCNDLSEGKATYDLKAGLFNRRAAAGGVRRGPRTGRAEPACRSVGEAQSPGHGQHVQSPGHCLLL